MNHSRSFSRRNSLANPYKVQVEVTELIHHTDSVSTIGMKPLSRMPRFKPGQFLHLTLSDYDPSAQWPESRVFSISSSPKNKAQISITYAVKGRYTTKMFDEIKLGSKLWLKFPYGSFLEVPDASDHILVAGGTGITPFLSILLYGIDVNSEKNYKLYYGIRTPDQNFFNETLKEIDQKLKNFNMTVYCENSAENSEFTEGIIDIEDIYNKCADMENPAFYLSGPVEMIKNFNSFLKGKGVSEEKIIIDDWE